MFSSFTSFKQFTRFALLSVLLVSPQFAVAQSSDSNATLLARQQMRLNNIEDSLKDVRGSLETELRALRVQMEQISGSATVNSSSQAAAIKDIKGQLAEITDSIDILNQRLRRAIEMSSDIEFRVLRMEKRMQTLLDISGDNLANAVLQDDVIAAGDNPSVAISRDEETGGSTWTVEKDEAVAAELAKVEATQADDNASLAANDNETEETGEIAVAESAVSEADTSVVEEVVISESVLPEGSPEEQYRFALGRALQNDLATAEKAFAEFRESYPDNERAADVLYWLGRVQFIQGSYEKSAMTFTEFNSEFQADSRLPDAILMIAESVANFATADQACQIFADLPQLLDQPPENFLNRLAELNQDANCGQG